MSETISLRQQIEEMRREVRSRADAYPKLIREGKMRQSEAAYFSARMEAALGTLVWLEMNEDRIKQGLALLRQAEGRP